ncbi:hypothetical protein Q3G72_007272 [Acer saccharum]|nr:hypothetical protein Q3G72_007272 [Acer saccharum]
MECIDHMFYVELLDCIICIHMITLGSPCKRHEVLTRTRCRDSQARKTWLGQEVRITKQEIMVRIGKVWIAMHGRLSRGISASDRELATLLHHRAVNAIFGGVDSRQFSYIQNLETTKEAWDTLQVTNEGTKAVKKSRLQMLTSQFERFKAKVTAIEESKDVDVMSLDEFLGSLQTLEACMKPMAKNKGLALKVVKEASRSDDEEEMALLVRKFRKFIRKGAKPSGKYSREKEVKKSFTPPHEKSGHVKINIKVQCFKCKKLGHYDLDCPNGDSKKDKKGKAIAATWSEDDDSSDEESSSDESSSEEELVRNFVTFTASHSVLEDVYQDSLDKKVDSNHQVCLSENPTYINILAKVKCLEDNLKIALREVDEKDDLIKL